MNEKLTKEEYDALQAYQLEMRAARNNYLRAVSREGQELLHKIYKRITGEDYDRTDACGHCQLELLQTVVKWYDNTTSEDEGKAKAKKK